MQSAFASGLSPRQLSFAAAMQSLAASWLVSVLSSNRVVSRLIDSGLKNLAIHTIGDRPGRMEPRAVKRRPKAHALLTKPRAQARAELLQEGKAP